MTWHTALGFLRRLVFLDRAEASQLLHSSGHAISRVTYLRGIMHSAKSDDERQLTIPDRFDPRQVMSMMSGASTMARYAQVIAELCPSCLKQGKWACWLRSPFTCH